MRSGFDTFMSRYRSLEKKPELSIEFHNWSPDNLRFYIDLEQVLLRRGWQMLLIDEPDSAEFGSAYGSTSGMTRMRSTLTPGPAETTIFPAFCFSDLDSELVKME